MKKNKNKKQSQKFYEAWNYLRNHPYFKLDKVSFFEESLSIEVVKVNPISNKIDDDDAYNISTKVWLECGSPIKSGLYKGQCSHDYDYDCGGDTFEEAIINLATIRRKKDKEE